MENIAELVRLEAYLLRVRKREQDFTRNRKMTFGKIIFLMLGTVRESTQNALDRALPRMGKPGTHMSQQAFSAARQKIRWEALEELFLASVEGSLNEEMRLWRGFRLMAIDGTFLRLPSDAALLEHFGGLGTGQPRRPRLRRFCTTLKTTRYLTRGWSR